MRFLIGFIIGLILGAVIVLLTTPRSGKDLQQQVKDRVNNILAEGRQAAEARRVELENRLADLKAGRVT
jgi:gas vesicle protein